MATETQHVPVLMQQTLEGLALKPGATVLDATLGGGGHATAICDAIGLNGTLIGIDQDTDAIERATERLSVGSCAFQVHNVNFRDLDTLDLPSLDAALFDLGWSSDQIADAERGLSFQHDGPLTMTLHKSPTKEDLTAFDVVNHWSEETLADIIYAFGDERYARRIARGIIERREQDLIRTTGELVEVITSHVPRRYLHGKIHPATRTFQALRIVVNDEYNAITDALSKVVQIVRPGGRIAVITFHSGEDKIVKEFFKQQANDQVVSLVTKKPLIADDEEIARNRRARSAKLRIVTKI